MGLESVLQIFKYGYKTQMLLKITSKIPLANLITSRYIMILEFSKECKN